MQKEKIDMEKDLETISEDFIKVNNELTDRNEIINRLTIENKKINNKLQGEWKANQELRKVLQNERNTIEDLNVRIQELKSTLRRLQRRLSRGGRLAGIHIPVEKIVEYVAEHDNMVDRCRNSYDGDRLTYLAGERPPLGYSYFQPVPFALCLHGQAISFQKVQRAEGPLHLNDGFSLYQVATVTQTRADSASPPFQMSRRPSP